MKVDKCASKECRILFNAERTSGKPKLTWMEALKKDIIVIVVREDLGT